MPNTYSQIYIQIVFAVKGRQSLISEKFRDRLEKYMCAIVENHKSKPLAVYCNPDHTHILIGLHPTISISEMARVVKTNSSKWINENKFVNGKFNWQESFGAFSYSKSQIDTVIRYILNQPEHHRKASFKDEYLKMLNQSQIEYDEKYLFEWLE